MSCTRCHRTDCPGCIALRPCAGSCGALIEADHLDDRGRCAACAASDTPAPTVICGWCGADVPSAEAKVLAFNLLCVDCHNHRRVLVDRQERRVLDRETGGAP